MDEFSRIDQRRNTAKRTDTQYHQSKPALPFQNRSANRMRGASRTHENGIKGAPVVTISYFNYMDRDLLVTTRDGTSVVVSPIGDYSSDEFVVCVTHAMSREAMERALDFLRNRTSTEDRETYYWIRAYENALYNNTRQSLSASVEYVIYHRDIQDAAGRCYMPDVDLLVEFLADHGAVHPFDKVKRDEAMVQSIAPGVGESTFVFMVKLVDNSQHVQRATRYVNLGGDIFMLPIERDLNYQTGVHVVSRSPIRDGEVVTDIIARTYTFEEADEKLGLRRTIEDAIQGGPLNDMVKAIIERETTLKKVEEVKLRGEQVGDDITLQRLRNEGALSRAQQDKEAAMRRNYVEWAKTGVALLGAAITIYGILSKLRSDK
ncbi:hypothetical protein PA10_00024 [Pseudomonas phage pPa_SNUABM_DT01]|nr:hypothetical protein PA10_00024 [Pseudomonas phage pPa_SNUABM_DT01]